MSSNKEGAYIVRNEVIDGRSEKVIYQVMPTQALFINVDGEASQQTVIDVSKVALLDPIT